MPSARPRAVQRRAASPLALSARLIAFAEDVERAGQRPAAERLLELAQLMLDRAWQASG